MRISNFHPRAFPTAILHVVATVLCVAFLTPNTAFACIWDRDTMASETDGRMDTLNAIVGNFDIFPPNYYEMRIERVAEELESDPTQRELYDDMQAIAQALDMVTTSDIKSWFKY